MAQNEILNEIRKIREAHAKSFNYDLDAMFADWQKKQAESEREVVDLSVREAKTLWRKSLKHHEQKNTEDASRSKT